jgi:hypothetical protein
MFVGKAWSLPYSRVTLEYAGKKTGWDKHSNLIGPVKRYEENEVLLIPPQYCKNSFG